MIVIAGKPQEDVHAGGDDRHFHCRAFCATVCKTVRPMLSVVLSVGRIANLKGHYFQPSLSVSLSVCLSVCVSLTGTSTIQR